MYIYIYIYIYVYIYMYIYLYTHHVCIQKKVLVVSHMPTITHCFRCCREASVFVVPDAAPFAYRSKGGGSSHRSYLFYKPGEKCRKPPVSSNMAGKSPNEMRIQMGKSDKTMGIHGLIPEKYKWGLIMGERIQLWPFISYKYWTNPIYRIYNPIYNQL